MMASTNYCNECGASNPSQATYCFACNNALHTPALSPLSHVQAASINATILEGRAIGPLIPSYLLHSRYSIVSQVGTGGFGAVYKAKDTLFSHRLVAIKEMNRDGLSPRELSEATAAFEREALLLSDLTHPNLPRIHDYFSEHERSYVVMDYIAGDTLEDYLNKVIQRLPVEMVLEIGIQLATVLDYLHNHLPPIIFRDVKPANIMRTTDNHVYLIDFGIARHFKPGKTKDTIPLGSKGYAAPEQYGKAQSTPQTDIYGLGATLHELLTGDDPSLNLFHFQPVPAGKRGTLPIASQLNTLLKQMLEMEMSKRPASMAIVNQELQNLLAQQKSAFSRRSLLKIAGYAGLVAATGTLTWLAESRVLGGPHPDYSPNLGGTICTYNTGSGVLGVAWSPDGMRLVMGNWQGQVQAFDANTGLNGITFQAPDLHQRVEAVIWLPGGKSIAACGDDTIVWTWNATSGKLQQTYRGHNNWVISLACSPDGKFIASGSFDKTVRVWEVATGRPVVIYRGHSDRICSVAWSADGSYIASASYDTTVHIWEPASGRPVYSYDGHKYPVYTVAWSPDGQRIASGDAGATDGTEGTVQVWPVTLFEGHRQQPLPTVVSYSQSNSLNDHGFKFPGNAVQAVAWSRDSRYIASVSHDIQIFDSFSGKLIYTYTKHTGLGQAVQAVAWSPNGRYIASGGMEGSMQVWNARL